MEVVSELSSCDRPRPFVMTLERLDLSSENRGRGIAIVVDTPMINPRAKIG